MTHYKTLGVDRTSSPDEIKMAYRRLAMVWHPDRNIGKDHHEAESKFKAIQVAYDILSCPMKRASYDSEAGSPSSSPFDFTDYAGFNDAFRQRHGKHQYRPPPVRGRDIEATIDLTIEQACMGATRPVTLKVPSTCNRCEGSGNDPDPVICPSCDGYGYKQGKTRIARCRKCHGERWIFDAPCIACDGKGYVTFKRKIKISIEGGTSEGVRIRVRGVGEKGENGGSDGDAYFTVNIKPHSRYRREGLDLFVTTSIDFVMAILGGSIEVLTPWGNDTLTIPPMTRANKIFRIVGAGLHRSKGKEKGDFYLNTVIDLLPGMETYPLSAEHELALRVMRRLVEDNCQKNK